jgi:integrase
MTHLATIKKSMADIRGDVAASYSGAKLRDTLSAFDTLTKRLGINLAETGSDVKALRELLSSRTAAQIGLSEKRWANVCSAIRTACDGFGPKRTFITRDIPLAPEWESLLGRIQPPEYRYGLYRLACFATSRGLKPEELRRDNLPEYFAALEEEERINHPRASLKHTISLWNMCRRSVPGWPDTRLGSPFPSTTYTYKTTDFPASFQKDLDSWRQRLLSPDPFDEDAPPRALRLVSVERDERYIRRVASVLIDAKILEMEAVTRLSVLVAPDLVKLALRLLLDRTNGIATEHVKRHAVVMRSLAKYYVKSPDADVLKLDTFCKRMKSKEGPGLRTSNREKLRQFDDRKKVKAFLNLPEIQRRHALRQTNPYRRAKGMERALAIAVLQDTGIRIKNLCEIRMDTNLRTVNGTRILRFNGSAVKNGEELEFELSAATAMLMASYLSDYRHILPGSEGPYLFPGKGGGAIAVCTMRDDIKKTALRRIGLEVHPHLFRHILSKIVVEADSEAYMAVSRHLGHRSLRTTMTSYLGTETRMAGRKVNAIIAVVKQRV